MLTALCHTLQLEHSPGNAWSDRLNSNLVIGISVSRRGIIIYLQSRLLKEHLDDICPQSSGQWPKHVSECSMRISSW